MTRRIAWVMAALMPVIGARAASAAAEDVSGVAFFERRIRPALVKHCYECHSAEAKRLKGNLLLDTREGIRRGGDSGHAVVPGSVPESLLIEAIRYENADLQMPPDGSLPARVIVDFEKWIAMGAPDPRDGAAAPVVEKNSIELEAARQFWAFQRPTRHEPVSVANAGWIRQPIDAFILARLEEAGLAPSAEADRRTLIRRVTFDLTGLPPTPDEVEAFVDDTSPNAYENLVERLLASPRYGERWARLWLDVARYAEDQAHIVGNDKKHFYPNAYRYRDWVIAALNDDMPYDRFVRLQLAADLIESQSTANHVALGFIGLGPKYYNRGRPEVMADEWEDRVDVVTRGLLGLTVACARCHDHKYDPITTADYYALAGVFAGTELVNKKLDGEDGPEVHIVEEGEPRDLNVLIRGNIDTPGPVAPRRFLPILCEGEPTPFTDGSGRVELAEAIVDPANPLTARVIVNRIWMLNFGQPLVGTPSNFGKRGEKPTHPLLLDDLAVRFMEAGWSLKWLQRQIVLSAAYRQTSAATASGEAADPANRLLWRMNRKRLHVEAWRDGILAAAGQLEASMGGDSISVGDPDQRRRSVYAFVSRFDLEPMLAMFDFPDPNNHAEKRALTITPLQKLFVINSPFMLEQSRALAGRLSDEVGGDDEQRVRRAYMLLFGRPVTQPELRLAMSYLGDAADSADRDHRWRQYAQVLLASNEMMYID